MSNSSYLHSEVKRTFNNIKPTLSRQTNNLDKKVQSEGNRSFRDIKPLARQTSDPDLKINSEVKKKLSDTRLLSRQANTDQKLQRSYLHSELKQISSDIQPPFVQTSDPDNKLQSEVNRTFSDTKSSLSRQTSDPGKKLHRSHAFRCDRSQKMYNSPKRYGSCHGRSESNSFSLKSNKKLSDDKLKILSNFLEENMKKENFVPPNSSIVGEVKTVQPVLTDSIPDNQVPKEILAQYAKVLKPKKKDTEIMTDSGVSSETENLEDDKFKKLEALDDKCSIVKDLEDGDNPKSTYGEGLEITGTEQLVESPEVLVDDNKNSIKRHESFDIESSNRVKRLMSHYENNNEHSLMEAVKPNLEIMDDLSASSETMKLERKNPHLVLTDTLKKALKQPLPSGPPPKKPPRTFNIPTIPENSDKPKKDPKKMLEKLEQVLEKRKAQKETINIPSAPETKTDSRPKEIHYLCTEILDITNRTLSPNTDPISRCLNSLNCAIRNSTSSLPYTRLSAEIKENCPCPEVTSNQNFSTFLSRKRCPKCLDNEDKDIRFKCHLKCNCKSDNSEFFIDKEHIYDEPFIGDEMYVKKNAYGTLNSVSKLSRSMDDLYHQVEDKKMYETPYEPKRPTTPEPLTPPKQLSEFEKLRRNFESGPSTSNRDAETRTKRTPLETLYEKPVYDESFRRDIEKTLGKGLGGENRNPKSKDSDFEPPKPALLSPKSNFVSKLRGAKSTENVSDETKFVKRNSEKKFATETKRYRNRCEVLKYDGSSQLDVDRENLNRLMNEIYETVTAVCNMDDNKPGSFPTDQADGASSEESVKLTRSLTEKRKNYVRRVSSRVAYLEPATVKAQRFRHQTSICSYKSETVDNNPYSTFRSWKSFRTSQNNLTRDRMERRESMESRVNLTDSRGNILSMGAFDSTDSMDKLSIDGKTGCVDIELPFEPRRKGLFNVCLLVGLNYMSGQAYVKSVFPPQVLVPPHIENLIFPETMNLNSGSRGEWSAEANGAQCYSLVLTDERGDRSYGYCRRVLPEGATSCLPLCYCLIGKYRAPGFYYKILQEIESHHGSSEIEIQQILQQLFEIDFPRPGESITVTRSLKSPDYVGDANDKTQSDEAITTKTDSVITKTDGVVTKTQGVITKTSNVMSKSKTLPDMRLSGRHGDDDANGDGDYDLIGDESDQLPDYYDLENNNNNIKGHRKVVLDIRTNRLKTIKRPLDPRVDEDNLSTLLDLLGAGLVVKVFGSLLLERKVIVLGDKLSLISSCLEALQSSLYPMVWQQPLISSIPGAIQRDVLDAPLPILGGALIAGSEEQQPSRQQFHEGMLIDLTHPSKVLLYQGDESTIIPTSSYKTLKTSLQMESNKHKDRPEDKKTRNLLISEAFLRFFVDILGDFWKYFHVGELRDGDLGKGNVIFDKEAFVRNTSSKQNQYFLEWFSETAMFNHFIQNMAASYHLHHTQTQTVSTPSQLSPTLSSSEHVITSSQTSLPRSDMELVDTPLPDFYDLFHERVRCRSNRSLQKNVESKTNYRSAVNKKVKMLKNKLRDLVA